MRCNIKDFEPNPPKITNENDIPKYKALNVYSQKNGGELAIFADPKAFANAKASVARKGQSSILRMQAPNGGRKI
jgi:hypothetical protein